MKKTIMAFIIMIIALGVSACNDATTQKEVYNQKNNNEVSIVSEETLNNTEETTEEITDETTHDKISSYMKKESQNAFSPYYELLDFQISEYKEEVVNGNIEATFLYKLIVKNYDKDPDTVGYIKEAKESGNKNYQQMYDEYLQPREMNFDLKIVIDEDNLITLYSNIAPKGIEWEETKMTDYILQ